MIRTKKGGRLGAVFTGVLFATTAVVGCGKTQTRAPSKEVPISGKITLDGAPLADAQVAFTTAGSNTFMGATDSAGTYKLWSSVGGEQKCEGPCKVTVSKYVLPEGVTPQPDMSPMMQGGKQLLPQKYWDQNVTELKANVPAEGGTFDFPLESK